MNIILFSPSEVQLPLPRADIRARHILDVLRRRPGDTFDAGIIDGPRGKATVVEISDTELRLAFAWGEATPPLAPIRIILGLPRPPTARDVLREGATLGVASLDFVVTEKTEAGYAQSSLWRGDEWRQHLVAGAAQAFDTRLPVVSFGRELEAVLKTIPAAAHRLVLDNYESPTALAQVALPSDGAAVTLALGAERGWAARERELFRAHGFAFVHLGPRVLRTETACVAAVTLIKAKLNCA